MLKSVSLLNNFVKYFSNIKFITRNIANIVSFDNANHPLIDFFRSKFIPKVIQEYFFRRREKNSEGIRLGIVDAIFFCLMALGFPLTL